jgi:ankyrin repeat protein
MHDTATACWSGHGEAIDILVSKGADVEAATVMCQTPLFWACGRGQATAAERLLAHGAQVNAQDINGDTPMHRCVPHAVSGEQATHENGNAGRA